MGSRDRAADDVSPITVCVYDSRLEPLDKSAERSIFPQIAPRSDQHPRHREVGRFQRVDEWVLVGVIGRKNGRHVSSVAALSAGKHRDYALEAPFSGRIKDMKYADATARMSHRIPELNDCDIAWIGHTAEADTPDGLRTQDLTFRSMSIHIAGAR
jgi:hypothetical protein